MKHYTDRTDPEVIDLLRAGKIGIMRTDTLYGILARADDESAVERVYELKGRDSTKSPIVLISSFRQLFDEPSSSESQVLRALWPGKVSVILPSMSGPNWLTRQNESIAYRLPEDAQLQKVLQQTGPLIAPSANPQGSEPAASLEEAVALFGDGVDFYVDGGTVTQQVPSQLVRLSQDGAVERLR